MRIRGKWTGFVSVGCRNCVSLCFSHEQQEKKPKPFIKSLNHNNIQSALWPIETLLSHISTSYFISHQNIHKWLDMCLCEQRQRGQQRHTHTQKPKHFCSLCMTIIYLLEMERKYVKRKKNTKYKKKNFVMHNKRQGGLCDVASHWLSFAHFFYVAFCQKFFFCFYRITIRKQSKMKYIFWNNLYIDM